MQCTITSSVERFKRYFADCAGEILTLSFVSSRPLLSIGFQAVMLFREQGTLQS